MSNDNDRSPGKALTGTVTTGGATLTFSDPAEGFEVFALSGDLSVCPDTDATLEAAGTSSYVTVKSGTSKFWPIRAKQLKIKGKSATAAYEVDWLRAL